MRRFVLAVFAACVGSCHAYGEAVRETPDASPLPPGPSVPDAQVDAPTADSPDAAVSDAPSSSLVADWPFDEGAGLKLKDVSGRGHDGIATGGSWGADRAGTAGSAFLFDGNDRISVTPHPDFDRPAGAKFSIVAWARAEGNPNHWYVFEVGFGTEGFGLELNGSSLTYWDGVNHVASAPVQGTSLWHHYGVVVDGSLVRTYLDGARVAEATCSDIPRTATSVYFGQDVVEPVYLKGAVDKVRFFRAALTDAEIAAEVKR